MSSNPVDLQCDEPWLGETDLWLLAQGRHLRPWEKLGAHPCRRAGLTGTAFAVWAPNALQVSVVGDFNQWQWVQHAMRCHPHSGMWEVFVPGVSEGALYKFAVLGCNGVRILKSDPYALRTEHGAGRACMVTKLPEPVDRASSPKARHSGLNTPLAIYEVHLGSWRRPDGQLPDWDYLAQTLLPYVADLGFTHIELLPVNEHPFYGSWGYQPTGLYAPSARYGPPETFRRFIASAHGAGLQVFLDWVPAHFPSDAHALAHFDGSAQF